jgi:hypothetical protein
MTLEFGLSVLVARTSLSLAALELSNSTTTYVIKDIDLGIETPILQLKKSLMTNGAILSNVTYDMKKVHLVIRVFGANDPATIMTNMATLKTALSQWSYTLTVTFGTNVTVFNCLPATIAYGSSNGLNIQDLRAGFQEMSIEIPVQP